jgi:hypothetical protein
MFPQRKSRSQSLPVTVSSHEVGRLLYLRIVAGQVSLHPAPTIISARFFVVTPTFVY